MTDTQINFQRLIKERAWATLKTELTKLGVPDITYLIEHSNQLQSILLFRLLSGEEAKEVFSELHPDKQGEIIDGLAHHASRLAALMNDMDPDDRTALFEELPGKISQQLMQLLNTENLKQTTQLLGYPEESIGRLMTPQYVAVKSYFTVADTLQHIRRFGKEAETLEVVYVVNQHWKLIADLPIRDILLAGQDEKIEELIDHKVLALNAFDDQETAIQVFKDYNRVALPVVDSTHTLLGVVTIDDIFDVAEEEDTEDFHKFGAMQNAVINPVLATVSFLYKKRVGWLMVLVFMNVFSGYAMSQFENVIETVVSLVFFLPLLIDSGGNAGSQSATLMIRALAIGDVRRQDWVRLLSKELAVSLLLGITMAAGVSLISIWRAPDIIPVVALTMLATVMVGSMIGMLLPLLFTRMKLDPATASAPMITTISDIMGVLIYFSMAKWFFGL